jgi:glycosyltransferase 2 family protein
MATEGSGRKIRACALKFVVTLFFLMIVISRVDLSTFKYALIAIEPLPAWIAAAVLITGAMAGSLSWYFVVRASVITVPLRGIVATYWSGMFFNSFLPSSIGGDFFKGWLLVRNNEIALSNAVSSIIVDRVINFSLLIVIGVVSLSLYLERGFLAGALISSALLLAAAFVVIAHCWYKKDRCGKFALVIHHCLCLFRKHSNYLGAFVAAALSQSCRIGCHYFLIRALHLDLPVVSIWFVIPLFGIISALPISIGGLGVREGVALWIANALGNVTEDLVCLSLAGHLLFVMINSLGLFPFLMNGRHSEKFYEN